MAEKKTYSSVLIAVTSILLFVLTHAIFGFYNETNDDLTFIWGMKGYVSLQPITDFLYYHHGLANIYAALYALTSKIAWYGWLMYAYLLISCILLYFILEQKEKKLWENLLLFTAFFAAIFYQQLVYFNFTRPAFLLIITSFLFALKQEIKMASIGSKPNTSSPFFSENRKVNAVPTTSNRLLKKSFFNFNSYFNFHSLLGLGCLLCFAIGFLSRPTTAYLSLVLLLPISLFLAWKHQCIKQVSRKIYFPILVLIMGFHLLQWLNTTPEKQAIIEKQAAIAHLVNAKITKEPDQWTARDSIVYEAAINWLVGDNETLTKTQLATYTFEEDFVLNATTFQKIPSVLKELTSRIWQNYQSVLCFLLVLWGASVWFLMVSSNSIQKREAWRICVALTLFQVLFVVLLVGVNITMKMPNRVLEPLLFLNMLTTFMLLPSAYLPKKVALGMVLGMFLLAYFPAKNTFIIAQTYQKSQTEGQQMLAELNQKVTGKTIVFTLPATTLMEDAHPLQPFNLSPQNQYLFLQGWLTALPNFYASLSQNLLVPPVSFKAAFEELVGKDDTVFIANGHTMNLLKAYFEEVYGVDFVFEEVEEKLASFEEKGIAFYRVLK